MRGNWALNRLTEYQLCGELKHSSFGAQARVSGRCFLASHGSGGSQYNFLAIRQNTGSPQLIS